MEDNKKKRRFDLWDAIVTILAYVLGDWVAELIVPDTKIINLLVVLAVMAVVTVCYTVVRFALFDRNKQD